MQKIELPDKIPVMVLPDCNLFPQGLLPLYIFEEKYREMVSDTLDGDRMFCIGTVDPVAVSQLKDGGEQETPPVFPYSTIGFMRACVGCEDGTSNLVLQGIGRVSLSDWDFSKSYLQARPKRIRTMIDCADTVGSLSLKLARLADRLVTDGYAISEQARLHLDNLSDNPGDLADFVAYNFIPSAYSRQILLNEPSLDKRLDYVIKVISKLTKSVKNDD